MSAEERADLEERLGLALAHRSSRSELLLMLLGGTLGYTILGLLVWAVAVRVAGLVAAELDWRGYMPARGGALALATIALVATLAELLPSWRNWRKQGLERERTLRADLAAGVVEEHEFDVTGVKRLRDPEHGVKYYFLRVVDGRVRVLCDFSGTELTEDRGQKALGPQLGARMLMTVFPGSGQASYHFEGERPKLSRFLEMTAPPKLWPEQDSWADIAWDDLDALLGGSLRRSAPAKGRR